MSRGWIPAFAGMTLRPVFLRVIVVEPAVLGGEAHPQPAGHLRIMTHLSKLFPMTLKHLPMISMLFPMTLKLLLLM